MKVPLILWKLPRKRSPTHLVHATTRGKKKETPKCNAGPGQASSAVVATSEKRAASSAQAHGSVALFGSARAKASQSAGNSSSVPGLDLDWPGHLQLLIEDG
jgi:hypothetical protein